MKNKLISLIHYLPKWKITLYVVLAIVFSVFTYLLLLPAIWYLEDNSRFFESLFFLLSYFREFLILIFFIPTLVLYLSIFYHIERIRYLTFHLRKIAQEVQTLNQSENKEHPLAVPSEFEPVAKGIRDIMTTHKQAVENVKKAEQAKSELITNVAHDLRSPLTSILGNLELINNDRYRDEVELRYRTRIIYDKAVSLHTLINDIFDYTYTQNQSIPLDQKPINLEEMLNQLLVQYKLQLENAGMEVRLHSTAKSPVVSGDGDKLVRVFDNLFQNAIRYGHEGKYIDIFFSESNHYVMINMTNYGAAIPQTDLPYIFERFYRVEKSRSTFTGGSGLGLAIAKNIVDLHGGTIEVNSTGGKITFTVALLK
ncbi:MULTISPECIES: sensor histidine kinase [Cytobacillus]|uniref:sensor histidine kinase n=1 Tax=Cytobacillus TaxID=2675230 RepID=UPI00203BB134|nr:HAMP domain-containing sensor histidine kinase [Cytobacillus firmus]MCM3704837.1 HAMP domain-containing histidine kinase [Cytobacillus firmus]